MLGGDMPTLPTLDGETVLKTVPTVLGQAVIYSGSVKDALSRTVALLTSAGYSPATSDASSASTDASMTKVTLQKGDETVDVSATEKLGLTVLAISRDMKPTATTQSTPSTDTTTPSTDTTAPSTDTTAPTDPATPSTDTTTPSTDTTTPSTDTTAPADPAAPSTDTTTPTDPAAPSTDPAAPSTDPAAPADPAAPSTDPVTPPPGN
jgi:hypothetical protein